MVTIFFNSYYNRNLASFQSVLINKNYNPNKIDNPIGIAVTGVVVLVLAYIYIYKFIYLTDTLSYILFYIFLGSLIYAIIILYFQKFPRKNH